MVFLSLLSILLIIFAVSLTTLNVENCYMHIIMMEMINDHDNHGSVPLSTSLLNPAERGGLTTTH